MKKVLVAVATMLMISAGIASAHSARRQTSPEAQQTQGVYDGSGYYGPGTATGGPVGGASQQELGETEETVPQLRCGAYKVHPRRILAPTPEARMAGVFVRGRGCAMNACNYRPRVVVEAC